MRLRGWLGCSVALNLLLLAVLWSNHRPATEPPPPASPSDPPPEEGTLVFRTNTVVRRLNFVWSQIESDDYATYIANLRRIGCPEPTVRDIIVADLNQLFAQRRATGIITPQQQWWQTSPDPAVAEEAAAALQALETERRTLLTELLGPDWESTNYPFPAASTVTPLDGPLLGTLPPATKAAVRALEEAAELRTDAYLQESRLAGAVPSPETLANLRQEFRQSLAELLTPEQLEEYRLRYDPLADELRQGMAGINLAPDEFRTLFRAWDALEQTPADADPTTIAQTESLDQQRIDRLREVLGEERFEVLKLSHDPLYQAATAIAEQVGMPDDKLVPFAAILRLTQEEQLRLRSDPTLTPEQRLDALQTTREVQRESLRQLLGEDIFQRYLENQAEVWENQTP